MASIVLPSLFVVVQDSAPCINYIFYGTKALEEL
jgi:hypothetical protein